MGFFDWLKGLFGQKKQPPMHAFVWLLSEPRPMEVETLRRIVERELQVTFPDGEDAHTFVVGEMPAFMVKLESHALLVNTFPVPYVNNPQATSKSIPELRLQKAVLEHQAWISADMLGEYEAEALTEGFRLIGKLAAALADDRCLALYAPHLNRMVPYAPELLDCLRSDDPLEALGWVQSPVINISGNDPRMVAAVADARRRWPEFVAAYESRQQSDQDHFAVKLPISDGQTTEFIWVTVAALEGDEIAGDLANQPVALRFMREGSRVRGKLADLNDWTYTDGDEMIGGFTSKVLMEAQAGKR